MNRTFWYKLLGTGDSSLINSNFVYVILSTPCNYLPMAQISCVWRLYLSSKVSDNLEKVSYDMYQHSEVAVKISSKSNIKNPIKTTSYPSPFLESWRTWRFLKKVEMESFDMYQSYKVAVKIS